MTAKKGIDTILAALALLQNQGIDFTYTLIGDGDQRDAIIEKIFTPITIFANGASARAGNWLPPVLTTGS